MKYLVVSVHDAAPPYLEELKRISAWLDKNAIQPRCFKVIPNCSGRWNICDSRDFLDWLEEEREKGSEIIQHGYLHVGTEDSGPLGHRLLSKFFTRQNAEFLNADYEHARSAIESGQQIMKDANLSCTGFTSPTWHQSKETEKALSDCGFLYYTSYSRLICSQKEMRVHSSALGDLGLSSFLSQMNMVKNEFMATTGFRCSPLARIVLHPQTPFESSPFSQALNTIVKLAGKRRIVTYRRFLESL